MFSDYFAIGWEHILAWGAWDHLLFILALAAIYTLQDWKQVIILVTAFTIGHSITLALSAFDIIRFNIDWVEFLIPVTIVLTALSNVFIRKYNHRSIRLNYYLALGFGLIHGMGFAAGLKSLLGKETSVLVPLLGFNLGLEAGQIVVVAATLLLCWILIRILGVNRREYVLFLSGGAFLAALIMALDRWPG